jgi:hypothetical protein
MGFLAQGLEVGRAGVESGGDHVTSLPGLFGECANEIGICLLFTHYVPSPN